MPVSSLPSPYGIGSFGADAREWVDFLAQAGQIYWQVLPLSPTGYGDSPYQSVSAFAGNPYFIDLDTLEQQGLLEKKEYASLDWGENPRQVDYNKLYRHRERVLRKAYARFEASGSPNELSNFQLRHKAWIDDYALFLAIKDKLEGKTWLEWPDDIRLRDPKAMERYRKELWEDIEHHIFVQYLFESQWLELKAYANGKGVYIIGDIPIYVAMDSADAWAHHELFYLDEKNLPIEVAGVPPDAFSADGQLWGNPLYRWDVMKKEDGYGWWKNRLRSSLTLYDMLRIDHFRGLESFYAVPHGAPTAAKGRWVKGPGIDFIRHIKYSFPDAKIIAEDLGFLTEEVHALLKESGYPGMKVLQFAFDSREESDYLPHNYDKNCVVYTGTHDNDTILGWFDEANPADVQVAIDYLNIRDDREGNWAFIRAALASVANLAVVPMADYLSLDGQGRINTPSTVGGQNWKWRMRPGAATPQLANKMKHLTLLYGRTDRPQKRKQLRLVRKKK